jgi:acetyl-CoA carboxylase biotin carboxyl carrier protein
MPEPRQPIDRSAAERQADHADLARLSETLVPALIAKLNVSGLGELEVREGGWRIRLRRPAGPGPGRRERSRPGGLMGGAPVVARPAAAGEAAEPRDPHRVSATAPAVGVFRTVGKIGSRVRQGDRIGVVDLLGIAQPVAAPSDGILVEFLVESGEPVEYGEEVAVVAEPVIDRIGGGSGDGASSVNGEGR